MYSSTTFPILEKEELNRLHTALFFMNLKELKGVCLFLKLPPSGKKGEIVHRIVDFFKTGNIINSISFPEKSKAKKGTSYPLTPQTLILLGAYKNDEKTRQFMKTLVGEHFHFTAFGQDWIKERWLEGTPPTYQEFANFWKETFLKRKTQCASPKQEWAYLNFIKNTLDKFPNMSRTEISQRWKEERENQKNHVVRTLENVFKKSFFFPS